MIADGTSDSELRLIQKIARDKGIKVEFVDRRALDKKSETGHHQGVIAIQSEFAYAELSEILKNVKKMIKICFLSFWMKLMILIIWVLLLELQSVQEPPL